MQTEIPAKLRDLLADSPYVGKILDFTEQCDVILADNEMPFFPAYTDHGTTHIGSVLSAAERLIPDAAWKQGAIEPTDAAVLIAAIFLHDLALHLREPGFLVLVSEGSTFKPLPWFDEEQRDRPADDRWPELWQDFRREARRFSQSQLDRILGPAQGEVPRIAFGDTHTDPAIWTRNDRLLVGEFLRRHHARLAHEIAIYGFPAIEEREFPVLSESLPALAEPIGATARSHNEDMRVVSDYLETRGNGDLRPDGAVQLYLMGVLRVADYFQLKADRATPLLMHLREPQSPASVEEWEKHQAISAISWEHKDPHAINVQISPAHNLRTHLQLADLIGALQGELDKTAAVLAETYGSSKLSTLQLSLQRVRTNLHEPDLHQRLSYVPQRARMRSAEDLFRLVVDDLYGNEPAVAGRELLQNAVDAVRERERWEARREKQLGNAAFRDQAADVVVEVRELSDEIGLLRISDRGIGMAASTITESFLTAGATFTPSSMESEDGEGEVPIRWMKAGRFGVGVFAAFLLGNAIQVTTRHPEQKGISFTALMGDDLVQLDWVEDAPLGTEIVVYYPSAILPEPSRWAQENEQGKQHHDLLRQIRAFFALQEPKVDFFFKRQDGAVQPERQIGEIPDPNRRLADQWRSIPAPNFDAVLWSLPSRTLVASFAPYNGYGNEIAHNGILIRKPSASAGNKAYKWTDEITDEILNPPSLAIFDTRQELKLALNRYELADSLSFESELLESIGSDIVAHALACGESPHPLAESWGLQPVVSRQHWFPLIPDLTRKYIDRNLCVLLVDSPELREVATDFLKGRTKGGQWRQLPYRVVLPPLEFFSENLEELEWKREDSLHRDHAEKEVTHSIDEFTRLFGMWPRTGVLVRPFAPQAITDLYGGPEEEEDAHYDLLREMGELLNRTSDYQPDFFALVMLGTVGPFEDELDYQDDLDEGDASPETWMEPLARAWEKTFGGMLERSPKAREKRRQEIGERDRQMRALANKWERLAKAPKWPNV